MSRYCHWKEGNDSHSCMPLVSLLHIARALFISRENFPQENCKFSNNWIALNSFHLFISAIVAHSSTQIVFKNVLPPPAPRNRRFTLNVIIIHLKKYIKKIPAHINISRVKDNARGKWCSTLKGRQESGRKGFHLVFFQPFQNVRSHHKQDKHEKFTLSPEILDSSLLVSSQVMCEGWIFPSLKYRYVFRIIVHDNKCFRKV